MFSHVQSRVARLLSRILRSSSDWKKRLPTIAAFFPFGAGRDELVKTDLKASISGQAVVASIVDLLGLDVQTATPLDLDRKDARFVCMQCATQKQNKVSGRHAFMWREAVSACLRQEPKQCHSCLRLDCRLNTLQRPFFMNRQICRFCLAQTCRT